MRIYRTTDKIAYKVGELEIKISPLSVQNKSELHDMMLKGQSGNTEALIKGSMFTLKVALKEVKGLEDVNGNPYVLEFDDNGLVTDECISDLMNLQESSRFIALCSQLIAGIPSVLPEGVSLVDSPK